MPSILLTAVAADPLDPPHAQAAAQLCAALPEASTVKWISPGKAWQVGLPYRPTQPQLKALRNELAFYRTDVLVNQAHREKKRLLLADMDSTIVQGETLDDLADRVGLGVKVADITARAMNGELDFGQALAKRVALLAGMPATQLAAVAAETRLMPGAQTLVNTMKANGAHCILISGGFTDFTGRVAKMCGFDQHIGNRLAVDNGRLTGQTLPPLVDKHTKLRTLEQAVATLGLTADDVIAVGDGANDIPMLLAAGMGVGFHPKPVVAAAVDSLVVYGDLTALLYAQGWSEHDFVFN